MYFFDLWKELLRKQHYVNEMVAHDLGLFDKAHQWSKIEGRDAPARVLQYVAKRAVEVIGYCHLVSS
jgi:hypothetical protein